MCPESFGGFKKRKQVNYSKKQFKTVASAKKVTVNNQSSSELKAIILERIKEEEEK